MILAKNVLKMPLDRLSLFTSLLRIDLVFLVSKFNKHRNLLSNPVLDRHYD